MAKKKHKDQLPGGLADKKKPSDFDKKQLSMGIKVEMEHTNDRQKAMEIAMDHLTEDPKYYTKLKQIEPEHYEKAERGRYKTYHSDPKEFVKRRRRRGKEYPKSAKEIGCGEGLSGKICRRNQKKLNKSEFIDNFKKSTYDFRDVKTSVDANEHAQAEKTASPELVNYLKDSVKSDLEKIPFAKGALTLYKKEDGLYSGYFQDTDGQTIQEFHDVTIPILAKNLEVKELYEAPAPEEAQHEDAEEDKEIAEEVSARMLEHHNEIYHQGQKPGEPINGGKGSLRIKMGDIDIEIKKSINAFINDFKKSKKNKQIEVIKALQSWRRNSVNGKRCRSDLEAAQELLREWDRYSEEFYQIMHAMQAKDE